MKQAMYQKIEAKNYERVFVVGDLHGCYDALMQELAQAKFNRETDLLISVGDLIDRGEQNLECLRLVNEPWFKMVQGNHDEMAIEGLLHNNLDMLHCWIRNGGQWFFKLSDETQAEVFDLLKICRNQPLVLELAMPCGRKVVIAHADYPENRYEFGKSVSRHQVLWDRSRVENDSVINIEGADLFIFGHTPQDAPLKLGNRLYIDTGAVFGGRLTLFEVK